MKRKLLSENEVEDDEDEDDVEKRSKLEHPFMRRARRLAAAHNVPLYHGMSLARQQDPKSYLHFKRSGVAPKMKKAAPDDVALAWNSAVDALVASGESRTGAMTQIRKIMPRLWNRFRK
jgi:hypothetical protein